MANQLLLLEDVDNLGRSGDLVTVRPGFARNFLLPLKKAVIANTSTLRMRARLQEERAKRAVEDKAAAEVLAEQINGKVFDIVVKVDPEGNLYGSVAAVDIVRLLEKEGIAIEKKHVVLLHAIKAVGTQTIQLRLKEGVPASFELNVVSDQQNPNA